MNLIWNIMFWRLIMMVYILREDRVQKVENEDQYENWEIDNTPRFYLIQHT